MLDTIRIACSVYEIRLKLCLMLTNRQLKLLIFFIKKSYLSFPCQKQEISIRISVWRKKKKIKTAF